MVTPSWPAPTDPNSQNDDPTNYNNNQQIENDVTQWLADKAAMGQEQTDIMNALAQMEQELKSGKPDAVFMAMMMFFTQIFPDILKFQETNMNLLADSQNISSDLRGFVNSIQTDFNAGTNITAAQSQDLYDNTKDLNNWAGYLSNAQPGLWNSTDCPLDPQDAQSIQQQMSTIATQFGGTTDPTSNWEGNVQGDVTTWFTVPTGGGNPPDPATQIKAIQSSLQQANSSVSTMATTTQTSEQFYTNQYNQLTGIDNSMQQNTISEESSLVTNQKTS